MGFSPTIVLKNGRFWTMSSRIPNAEAVAIYEKNVAAVGNTADIERLIGPGTEVVDLEGRVACPGLADIHVHLMSDAADANAVDIRDFYFPEITSIKDIYKRIKEKAEVANPGEWIHANGNPMQDSRLKEKRLPNKDELDRASPDNPCYISFGAHILVANTLALKAAGITRDTPDPVGGWIMHDATGEPNGVLRERAQRILFAVDNSKVIVLEDGAERLLRRAATRGTTMLHDVVTSNEEIKAYQNLREQGRMSVRVQLLVRIIESDITAKSMIELGYRQGFGDDMVKIGGSKMSIDGGISGRQAAFRGLKHLIRIDQKELDETVEACHINGVRCCIHALGDLSHDMAISAIEKAQKKRLLPDIRHRVEHLGNHMFDADRRARAKAAYAVPVTNPALFYHIGDPSFEWIGPERNKSCHPLKTMLDEEFPIAFGSDATEYYPVDSIRDIACMVTRRTRQGTLMEPQEAITFREGIQAQTVDAAWVGFEESRAGRIEVGRIADICVFDEDPDGVDPVRLKDLPVKYTICAGKWTHRA